MTVKQKAALQALLSCNSRREAAKQAGISERTLRGYFQDEAFVNEYNRAFGELMDTGTRMLQKEIRTAVETLHGVMTGKESSEGARNSAARTVLDMAPRYTELNDIIQRIEQLERSMENDKH